MTQVRGTGTESSAESTRRRKAWVGSLAMFGLFGLWWNGPIAAWADEPASPESELAQAGDTQAEPSGSATAQAEGALASASSEPAASGASTGASPTAAAPAGQKDGETGTEEIGGKEGMKEAMGPSAKEALGPKTGLYFGIFGGAAFGMSNGVSALDSPPLFSAGGRATPGTAAVGGLEVGYNFRSYALDSGKSYWLQPAAQFEAFYLGQATESGSLTGGVAGTPGISSYQFGSNLNMGVFLVDGVAKLVTPIGLVPYIGGGIGGAYLASSGTSFVGPAGNLLSSGSYAQGAFAGQGLAGLQYNLNEHWSIFAEYKILYIKETQFSYGMTTGNTMLIKYPEYYNIAIAGLRFNF
ncbi:hypothetical protein [Methylacidimicrobium sp. B4]|uniref:hypothetical protein n=1 Tax=Methylacidimicrobium sp. B4 TaxID=2796139 RepID=UPI001A9054D7|nr:hypothetical protein [Methylacidimicrobium sp. B4]QSR84571.1 hypothetical protein MacB4_10300 [Methylacidimicrobium sp. B4]